MNLDIVIRTHDTSNVHTDRQRYTGLSKFETIVGCLNSLANSINKIHDYSIHVTVLDDHSSSELIEYLLKTFSAKLKYSVTVVMLDKPGYNFSALKQFEFCRDSKAELVYSVEDDYLHHPNALRDMLDSYRLFVQRTGKEVCIYPFDMPDDYIAPHLNPCYLVHGIKQHWRTGLWTTNTMMCRPQVFKDHWHHFEKLANEYNPTTYAVHEGNTICDIWKNHVLRFSPIPSLALHLQFDTQKDPYIDWVDWWAKYASYVVEEVKP